MASYNMDGEALLWDIGLFTLQAKKLLWKPYKWDLETTSFNDPMEALISLKISTKVAAYKSQLIAISNRIKGLFEKHKLKFFLKVLKNNINLWGFGILGPSLLSLALQKFKKNRFVIPKCKLHLLTLVEIHFSLLTLFLFDWIL